MSRTVWIRMGILVALIVPLGVVGGRGTRACCGNGASDEEKTPEAKSLEKVKGLREELAANKTYQKLKEVLPKLEVAGTTYYVAEGDLLLDDDQLLFHADELKTQIAIYNRIKDGVAPNQSGPAPGSIVILRNAQGDFLGFKPGSTIKYVINKTKLGGRYDEVKRDMAKAVENWRQTGANIFFEHLEGKDDLTRAQLMSPGGEPIGFTFLVEPEPLPGNTVAMAFFPPDPKKKRRLLLGDAYFTFNNKSGVLTHELGHILGFRHEHIVSGAPMACRALGEQLGFSTQESAYDPTSVMHYPCGGVPASLTISPQDRKGVRDCYGTFEAGAAGGFAEPTPPVLPGKSHPRIVP